MSRKKNNRISLEKHRQEYKQNQAAIDRALLRNAELERIMEQEENFEIVSIVRKYEVPWDQLELLMQGLLPNSKAPFLNPEDHSNNEEETKNDSEQT